MRSFLRERGITPVDTSVELREADLSVEKISLTVELNTDDILYQSEVETEKEALKSKMEEIKKELSEVYQLELDHIDVAIQG